MAEVQQMRVQHGSNQLLQVPLRDIRIGIFEGNNLALFRYSQPSPGGRERLRLDAAMGLSTPAVNRAALAVKKAQADTALLGHLRQPLLGAKERPVGGQVTSVLDRVGIAQHDLLKFLPGPEDPPVKGVVEESLHDFRAGFQIIEGFEEGDDVKRGFRLTVGGFNEPGAPPEK